MFNFPIMVVMALCACLHSSQRRNEVTLTAPVTMLKCTVSIFPENRNILGQKVLSDQELTLVHDLFEAAHKDRYAFVCCEYFLQTDDGRTVGILMDNEKGLAEGFDLGVNMNAKETRTKRFHNTKMIQRVEDQKKLYSLVHELFSSHPN